MSHSDKRDASQAFGVDSPGDRNSETRKRSRRRRSGQTSQENRDSETAAATATITTAPDNVAPSTHHDTKSPKRASQKTPQSTAKTAIIDESPTIQRQSDPHEPDVESVEGSEDSRVKNDKKKSGRSKRHKKPQFDVEKSQMETILTHASKVDDVEDVPSKIELLPEQIRIDKRVLVSGDSNSKHNPGKTLSRRTRPQRQPLKWHMSKPAGGAFIDHDPILTSDQQFLILATKQNILVYSVKTSLLIRTIPVTSKADIVSLALIINLETQLVVGTSDGTLSKFDWTDGRRIWTINFSGSITAITSTSSSETDEGFLMIHQSENGVFHMSSLAVDKNGKQIGRRSLLHQDTLIKPQICFSAGLGAAVVCSKESILIGRLDEDTTEGAAVMKWQTVPVTAGKIVCFNAQISPSPQLDKKGHARPLINVAVGLRSGEIHLYNDILRESHTTPGGNMLIRRLHWHRAAPRSLKLSPDANYLISGGDETVLVIWQLDTNQKQVLPHLTASILSITISVDGAAYAVRLADNSVMLLSTADLKPIANVSNLAVDASFKGPYQAGSTIPAALHPNHDQRLLLAYSLQNLNRNLKPSEKSLNMLQTFDLSAQLQLNRQALARNFVSTVNIGPNGQPIQEPDVTHLDISHDGQWLVTVDQWSPGSVDLDAQYLSRKDQPARAQRNECFLRFWSTGKSNTDNGTDLWELNTRVDNPITTDIAAHKKAILAIAVNPARLQVAVADTGRCVKFYSPKQRMRSGVAITDAAGRQLYTWTCDHEVYCTEASSGPSPEIATMAFSEDGSVLATSWASDSHLKARVHLIDTKTAVKAASLTGVVSHGHAQIAWYGRYLVGLSEKLCVYDTVIMQQTFAFDIESKFVHGKARMAVNPRSGVVAVAASEKATTSPSHLVLFDIEAGYDKPPVMDDLVRPQIKILLPERQSGGFVVVDGEGRTSSISPPGSKIQSQLSQQALPERKVARGTLENVFGNAHTMTQQTAPVNASTHENKSLEDVFKFASSNEVPATKELFHRVALAITGAAA